MTEILGTANCASRVNINNQVSISGKIESGTSPYTVAWSIKRPDGTYDPAASAFTGLGPYRYRLAQKGDYVITFTLKDSCPEGAMQEVSSRVIQAVEAPGSLNVTSYPGGAYLVLDGVDQNVKTPALIQNLPPGSHAYTLKLSGYSDISGTVLIESGKIARLNVNFKTNIVPLMAGVLITAGTLGMVYYIAAGGRK